MPSAESYVGIEGDLGLVANDGAKHHAIVKKFDEVLDTIDKDLVVQYEVKFQKSLECGGAYIKLLTNPFEVDEFDDSMAIMQLTLTEHFLSETSQGNPILKQL